MSNFYEKLHLYDDSTYFHKDLIMSDFWDKCGSLNT